MPHSRAGILQPYETLIEDLIASGVLHSEALIAAFRAIDRADFVPAEHQSLAYADTALPIGHGQTISQPYTVAFMLELLNPKPGDTILDVGCGSGWQTALLSHVVSQDGKQGRVIGIELIPELAEMAERSLNKYSLLDREMSTILCQNAESGLPAEAPFDGIIGAASADEIPPAWKEQVKVGGRIVLPIGSDIVRLTKVGANEFDEDHHPGFAFVPFMTE